VISDIFYYKVVPSVAGFMDHLHQILTWWLHDEFTYSNYKLSNI